MYCVRQVTHLALSLAAACVACSSERPPAVAPPPARGVSDDSPICKAVLDRFVGVPAPADASATQAQPVAGRWWIRGCSAERVPSGIRVRLSGPGWYFVDEHGSHFAVRQQVPFTLGVELEGPPEFAVSNGIAALWFEPRAVPKVELSLAGDLQVHATSAWGSVLNWVPLVSVRDIVARRLSDSAVAMLREELSRGTTATYDLSTGQSDVALGRALPGHMPKHGFSDGVRWVINDRLLLPHDSTQVVGPIEPGSTRLDVNIEQGEGLAYRALCKDEMPSAYSAIASGQIERSRANASAAEGAFAGLGNHSVALHVDGCKFFIVVAALGAQATVASLRVRG